MDRNALAELLQALESRRDAEERRREERYTALIERVGLAVAAATTPTTTPYPPFFDDNPFGIYQKILAGKIDFPRHLDFNVKDLIKKFLVVERTRRLGNMKNGADDVKKHRWFKYIDWDAVPQRKLKPPVVPKVSHEGDTSNFEAYPEDDWKKDPPVPPKDLEMFKNF
ncbi:UNVERIFIED_CONTAM: hypothetical protein FKN15_066554 [Acipenser sinensis]